MLYTWLSTPFSCLHASAQRSPPSYMPPASPSSSSTGGPTPSPFSAGRCGGSITGTSTSCLHRPHPGAHLPAAHPDLSTTAVAAAATAAAIATAAAT